MLAVLLILCLLLILQVEANVEKLIFVADAGRGTEARKEFRDSLIHKGVPVLTPTTPTLRQKVHAPFPESPSLSSPKEAWLLLDGLEVGRRYEIRAIFSASQPCDVNQTLYRVEDVLTASDAKNELDDYLTTFHRRDTRDTISPSAPGSAAAPLLYRVEPTANFFAVDKQLMRQGHVVDFEFTLDPFLLNIFPSSLLPTAIYIGALAALSILLATTAWSALQAVALSNTEQTQHKPTVARRKND